MYKVIIIDDEKMSRDVISGYLKRNLAGFSVEKCFSDGETALEYIKANRVDVVITDIKMPGISGLDLIEKIYSLNYDCRIIIISGYSEFEYAQAAVKYHVENYILKPIDVEELIGTLNKIKEKLDADNNNSTFDISTHYEKKEEFFLDLVQGVFKNNEEIKSGFLEFDFNISFEDTSGYLFIVKIMEFQKYIMENWKYGKESVYNAFLNVFRTNFGFKNIYMVKSSDIQFFFIGFSDTNAAALQKNEIEKAFFNTLNLKVDIVKEVRFSNICDIPLLVKDFLNVDNSISVLLSHIINSDKKEAVSILSTCCKNDSKLLEYIIDNLYYRLKNLNITIPKMESFSDYEKTIDYLIKSINTYNKKEDLVIKNAIIYIENHYQNDISREDVANAVYLESTYFSKYFKKQTGETFHNYLFNFRMNKAKELLKSDKSITEVSQMVGYGNIGYFNKKFKQFTGLSPSEYKKQFEVEDKA